MRVTMRATMRATTSRHDISADAVVVTRCFTLTVPTTHICRSGDKILHVPLNGLPSRISLIAFNHFLKHVEKSSSTHGPCGEHADCVARCLAPKRQHSAVASHGGH